MIRRILATSLFVLAFATVSSQARAERDAVQFFQNIHVAPESSVHDAVCFFCNVDLRGKTTGDVVVFFGSVHISGVAGHDVVNFFGDVTADDNSSVEHDLVSMFGGVRLGENVKVGDDMVTMFGSLHAADSVTVGNDRVYQPAWIFFGPLGFICLIVWFIVHEFRSHRRRILMMRQYPPPPPRM